MVCKNPQEYLPWWHNKKNKNTMYTFSYILLYHKIQKNIK
jgi:hypothetical protein